MKKDLILVDVDGVLLEWYSAFADFVYHKGLYGMGYYSPLLREVYNVTEEVIIGHVDDFNTSDAFGELVAYHTAADALKKLKGDGYSFVAITACGSNPVTASLRKKNLTSRFGDIFDDVICVDNNEGKRIHLEHYAHRAALWVEDHIDNAHMGLDLGIPTVLMGKVYNEREETRAHRAITWDDVYAFISDKNKYNENGTECLSTQ